ncbi:hypothetical protein [Janthinobacterium sp. 17J80-10]|uniref:hypothetical protein n=1 Tax=Janthinobacterium sp. 17J80-10 TaxID=2497863 RepID=UPI0013E8A87D|nr:hypothetical protein [Janthinobacterium sp. 17J80-10]
MPKPAVDCRKRVENYTHRLRMRRRSCNGVEWVRKNRKLKRGEQKNSPHTPGAAGKLQHWRSVGRDKATIEDCWFSHIPYLWDILILKDGIFLVIPSVVSNKQQKMSFQSSIRLPQRLPFPAAFSASASFAWAAWPAIAP